ncbi:rhamnogalacturonan acetylesterase [Paenibacillus sp. P26]|nr:rhamnogalacturonan acetylesterase [Paenibacillus sp. P26]
MGTTTIYIAGDSTAASYPPEQAPMAGWGQMLGSLLSAEVVVSNLARCGRGSRSFIDEGHLERIAQDIGPCDYLFIQFGHNDQKKEGAYADPYEAYPANLKQYVSLAQGKGAVPVLFTPVERRHFDETGTLLETHGDYPEAVRKLAAELNVTLIDLWKSGRALYESLGPEDSKRLFVWLEPGEHPNYPDGARDNTHFNEEGALEIARRAAEEIGRSDLALAGKSL